MTDGWWNRNDNPDRPNNDGPGGIPWLVWIALAFLVVAVVVYAATRSGELPGPLDPDTPAPTAPAVIMPVNSWS